MPKKAAKKTTTVVVAPELSALIPRMKELLEEAQRLSPILDQASLRQPIERLSAAVREFGAALQGATFVSPAEFANLQPLWSEMFQLDSERLIKFATSAAGLEGAKQKGEKDPDYQQRLLLAVLRHGGGIAGATALIAGAKAEWQRERQSDQESAQRHVTDPEAHAALKAWGQMTEKDFLVAVSSFAPEMIQRAAKVMGLETKKKLAKTDKQALYKKARRFFVNTQM